MRVRTPGKIAMAIGLLALSLLLIGCGTVRHRPFQQFSTSIQELREGANAAFRLNETENRDRFITETAEALADMETGPDAVNNLQLRSVDGDVFGWDMEEVPLFMISGRFRQGVHRSIARSLPTPDCWRSLHHPSFCPGTSSTRWHAT